MEIRIDHKESDGSLRFQKINVRRSFYVGKGICFDFGNDFGSKLFHSTCGRKGISHKTY
jgi:hypothetical protein